MKTPMAAVGFVPVMNAAIRRVAARHAPAVRVLDAHQMVEAHPWRAVAGYPPGLWPNQTRGWHFGHHLSREERTRLRALRPPSMVGEMYRAIANRIYDAVCPLGRRHPERHAERSRGPPTRAAARA